MHLPESKACDLKMVQHNLYVGEPKDEQAIPRGVVVLVVVGDVPTDREHMFSQ